MKGEGNMRKNINQITADKLDKMELSERARNIIAQTDINVIEECFGGLETAEEVEQFIKDEYPEEE